MPIMVSFALLTLASNVGAISALKVMQKPYTDTAEDALGWMKDNYPKALTAPDWGKEAHKGVFYWHAHQAWKAKYSPNKAERLPWTAEYSDEIFLNYVLPITHFDEKPEAWMKLMREALLKNDTIYWDGKPDVVMMTDGNGLKHPKNNPKLNVTDHSNLRQVAQEVVENVWTSFGKPYIEFKANQTPEVLSPLSDVLVKRHGSCTAMSIFLADALRSMGVPARVTGIAVWNRPEGGNHNWVEAYFDHQWNFIDAVPGVTWWNTAWFTEDGTAQKSVASGLSQIATPVWNTDLKTTDYHVTWSKDEKKYPESDDSKVKVFLELPAIDRTAFYKDLAPKAKEGAPAKGGSKEMVTLSVFSVLAVILSF